MKAIETSYAGCLFRSRLEARWAVFFDALRIEWQYEPEGFELPSGWYLPDFWLPKLNKWIEIKGDENQIKAHDWSRWYEFAVDQWNKGNRFSILAGGVPKPDIGFSVGSGPVLPSVPSIFFTAIDSPQEEISPSEKTSNAINFFGVSTPGNGMAGKLITYDNTLPEDAFGFTRGPWVIASKEKLFDALQSARSARFEHGQSGASQ